MTGVPPWAFDLDGFSVDRWWMPIVCTHGHAHDAGPLTLLGIAFDHSRDKGIFYTAGPIRPERIPRPPGPQPALFTKHPDGRPRASTQRRLASRTGSVNLDCPGCPQNVRRTSADWDKILEESRRAQTKVLDVSRLG